MFKSYFIPLKIVVETSFLSLDSLSAFPFDLKLSKTHIDRRNIIGLQLLCFYGADMYKRLRTL